MNRQQVEESTLNWRNEEQEALRKDAIRGFLIFLAIYTPFSIAYYLGRFLFDLGDSVNFDIYNAAVILSAATVVLFTVSLIITVLAGRLKMPARIKLFRFTVFFTALLFISMLLIHMHFAGSQSSIMSLMILSTGFAVSWFLPWFDSMLLMILGHAGIVILVVLEKNGILPYLPLLNQGDQLGEIFLRPEAIFTNAGIYITNLTIVGLIFIRSRRALNKARLDQQSTNQNLKQEIEFRKRSQREKEKLIEQLQKALKDVKELKGLLPVCANCKKIRDDQGYWQQLEAYLQTNSDIEVTHSICPECAKRLYPEFVDDEE